MCISPRYRTQNSSPFAPRERGQEGVRPPNTAPSPPAHNTPGRHGAHHPSFSRAGSNTRAASNTLSEPLSQCLRCCPVRVTDIPVSHGYGSVMRLMVDGDTNGDGDGGKPLAEERSSPAFGLAGNAAGGGRLARRSLPNESLEDGLRQRIGRGPARLAIPLVEDVLGGVHGSPVGVSRGPPRGVQTPSFSSGGAEVGMAPLWIVAEAGANNGAKLSQEEKKRRRSFSFRSLHPNAFFSKPIELSLVRNVHLDAHSPQGGVGGQHLQAGTTSRRGDPPPLVRSRYPAPAKQSSVASSSSPPAKQSGVASSISPPASSPQQRPHLPGAVGSQQPSEPAPLRLPGIAPGRGAEEERRGAGRRATGGGGEGTAGGVQRGRCVVIPLKLPSPKLKGERAASTACVTPSTPNQAPPDGRSSSLPANRRDRGTIERRARRSPPPRVRDQGGLHVKRWPRRSSNLF
eukprot:1195261-Prorocentrum_minimum.AAC.2